MFVEKCSQRSSSDLLFGPSILTVVSWNTGASRRARTLRSASIATRRSNGCDMRFGLISGAADGSDDDKVTSPFDCGFCPKARAVR